MKALIGLAMWTIIPALSFQIVSNKAWYELVKILVLTGIMLLVIAATVVLVNYA